MNNLLMSFLKENKNNIFKAILLNIIDTFLTFSILITLGYLLAHAGELDQKNKASTLLPLFLMILGINLLSYLNDFQFKFINAKLTHYSLTCWQQLLSLPLSTIKNHSSSELTKNITNFESSLDTLFSNTFHFISHLFLLLLLFSYLFYCHFYLTIFYFFTFIFLLLLKISLLTFHDKKMMGYFSNQNKYHLLLNESILQIDKIRTTNSENIIIKKFLTMLLTAKTRLQKSNHIDNYLWIAEIISFAILLLTTYYSNINFIFLLCAGQLILLYEQLGADLLTLFKSFKNLKSFSPFLKIPAKQQLLTIHHPLCGDIKLVSVSFNTLVNVNLHIPSGYFVGLTGASGVGKSTLFNLILGIETTYTGTILLDNHNIANYNLDKLRQQIGVVTQTSSLFTGTIFSNISVNSKITLDEAWQLAHAIGLADEIAAMPMQMFTYISDNAGDSISGGQRQKILLARALATKPKMLLLDEATSALDETSQAIVFNYLNSLKITRFVIAHRLSTLQGADYVYRLENGQLMLETR